MQENNKIKDLVVYLDKMQKTIYDKIFFVDKIFEPVSSFVDFGCADGELIKTLMHFKDDMKYYGYDISEEMIESAKRNVPGALFSTDWDSLGFVPEDSVLNISSTVHEVYSYCSDEDIAVFLERVFKSGFRYIAIRDMSVADADDVPVAPDDIKKLRAHKEYLPFLEAFEKRWGKIERNRQFIHFLLKYTYTKNWDRELNENYLPISTESLFSLIPDDYEIVYYEHYVLPFKKWETAENFGIDLKVPTHVKILLKKKKITEGKV